LRDAIRFAFYHAMRRVMQSLSKVFGAAVLLYGCATYDDPYYVHSVYRPAVAADAHVSVFYLTDRHYDPNFSGGFTYQREGTASCGTMTADVPPARLPGGAAIFASEVSLVPQICGTAAHDLAATIARDARQKNCASVLVWVHGFDTGSKSAMLRAAQLGLDTQWHCPVVAFDWTSSGNRTQYDADLQNARDAEPMFGEFLRALSGVGLKAEIVAHSMGTRLVLEALANHRGHADQVVFAAPDIGIAQDNDEFATLARAATPNFRRLTIYASREDAVLAISKRLNDGVPRLGREPLAAYHDAIPNVDVIDASDVPGDYTGHNYYGLSYEIIADMALALDGVPAAARLEPRAGAGPTLVPGDGGLLYRLNVADNRTPDAMTRFLRWLASLFAG
jgi:esterase/lipase superfamily enzyme